LAKRSADELLARYRATSAVVVLDDGAEATYRTAAQAVQSTGLPLFGWIEVARNRTLADAHPEWLASLGMHDDWRSRFPSVRKPQPNEVVKVYPWVPIWTRPAYAAHLERVRRLLERAPRQLAGLYVNDIQAGPSSCGCGNDQCRWATDYHVLSTAEKLSDPQTPAKFLRDVGALIPNKPVVPVWCIECEDVDQKQHPRSTGYCGGVGCYPGLCWKEYTRQLTPISSENTIAIAAMSREFRRTNQAVYANQPWLMFATRTFQELVPRHGGQSIPPNRLVAVIQGWNVSDSEIDAQIAAANAIGLKGFVLALEPIDQSWEPKLVKVPGRE
jgi:hypothetical protein